MRVRIGLLTLVAVRLTLPPVLSEAHHQPQPSPPAHRAQPEERLFLALEDFTRPYVRILFEAFSTELLSTPDAPAIFFESLDASRFEQKRYLEDLRAWLRRTYADTRVDTVVALGEDVVAFLADGQGEPWPSAQVLYLEAGSMSVDTRGTLPRAGGCPLEDHFADAVGVIRTILPDTKAVALHYGASAVELARYRGFAEKVSFPTVTSRHRRVVNAAIA